jgi:hypothetical protein
VRERESERVGGGEEDERDREYFWMISNINWVHRSDWMCDTNMCHITSTCFRSGAAKIFILLGLCIPSLGLCCPQFWGHTSSNRAHYPRRVKIWTIFCHSHHFVMAQTKVALGHHTVTQCFFSKKKCLWVLSVWLKKITIL